MVRDEYHDAPGKTTNLENREEVIYNLLLEEDAVTTLEESFGISRDEMECGECERVAVWFVSEIKQARSYNRRPRDRENHLWCDECIPMQFKERWAQWPWTPDDDVEIKEISELPPNECTCCGGNIDWTWLLKGSEVLCRGCIGVDLSRL
ncbi:hypothetical protein ACERIM_19340 [Natrinema sp. H-ect1]|uniref:hypothetical protein n=1 Tax=Natrinema sp. H-ect1 TaxID=3242700 RepID=UPI00359D558D